MEDIDAQVDKLEKALKKMWCFMKEEGFDIEVIDRISFKNKDYYCGTYEFNKEGNPSYITPIISYPD